MGLVFQRSSALGEREWPTREIIPVAIAGFCRQPRSTSPTSPPIIAAQLMTSQTSQLDRIEAKLDRLQAALDRAGPLIDAFPDLLATVGNTIDDLAAHDGHASMDQRLRRGAAVLAKLSDPTILAGIERLLGHREALTKIADLVDHLPGYVAIVGDSFDDIVEVGRARGIDPEVMIRALFESGLLETRSVELLSGAAAELPRAAQAPSESFGVVGLLRVLREDEVQRALSFLIHFIRRFGRLLDERDRK
jgi:hypothetical protein